MKIFNSITSLYIGLFGVAVATSCAPTFEDIDNTAKGPNQANFSKYIAIGNSLSAGMADGGLYLEGQKVAYTRLLAEQMKSVGGSEFNSPFFSEEQKNGSGYIRLKALVNGNPVTENVTDHLAIRGLNPQGKPLYTKYTADIQNLGVPGMRMDMAFAPGIGTVRGNPYFERLLPDNAPPTTTYFDYTTTKNHTFFSFWLGNNDILGYATNGGYEDPADPTTTFTSVATFKALLNNYINTLTTNERKGVIATIPDVTTIPMFTTVTTARLAAGVSASTNGQFTKIYIQTASGPREATNEDLFTLRFPTDTLGKTVIINGQPIPGYGLSPLNPLHDKFVLDRDEVKEIEARVKAFNDIIIDIAIDKKLALADANAFLNNIKRSPDGIYFNGIKITTAYITGNAFSLDGVHLTPIGNALIANVFIDAINKKYNSGIPKVDITKYRGVIMP